MHTEVVTELLGTLHYKYSGLFVWEPWKRIGKECQTKLLETHGIISKNSEKIQFLAEG